MIRQRNIRDSVTGERLPFFVQTNKRCERFATIQAAELFMELHCAPWCKTGGAERIVKTNVISKR